ncbi:pre-mRNA-splicing factor CWC22-like [Arapaima gigas]
MAAKSKEAEVETGSNLTSKEAIPSSDALDPPQGRRSRTPLEEAGERDERRKSGERSGGDGSPANEDQRSREGSSRPSSRSGSHEDSSDEDSDSSEDSDTGGPRRMKSRVAHIRYGVPVTCVNNDGVFSFRGGGRRYRSRSRSQSRSRSRSPRSQDRGRSEDRDHLYQRGYSGTARNSDREQYPSRDRDREWQRYRERERDRERYQRRSSRDRERDRRERSSREREVESRRRGWSLSPTQQDGPPVEEPVVKKKKEELDPILTRTGGAYIPPARLRMMQAQITDKASLAYQRMSWEALKKSINGLINKVNVSNIANIIHELLQENIVRGRGLLARSVLQAQGASPIFTHVYAAVVAIINSKFPQIGELILKRLILNFRKGYRRNDKQQCLTASKFVAHLINQNVAHEVLCLEMLTLLLERPTDDSVEVAISFLKECGLKLTEVSPRGINAIFERLRNVLHESEIDKRVQYMIEVMFAIRKDGFKDHPVILEGLDLVEEDDQFTHMLPLEDDYNPEDVLSKSPYLLGSVLWVSSTEILDEGSSDSGDDAEGSDEDENDEEEEEEEEGGDGIKQEKVTIFDKTEVNLVAFRRTIYLAIQSSLDFEECAHKLIKMDFPESQTKELCNMILDCCAQQRTYEKFFGLLAGRFCLLKKDYMESFEAIFQEQYETIHRLETNKLRNVARMFAHLLYTDSVPWSVLECIKMSEDTTTSSSRIFVKILFQELCAYMGLPKLNERLKDLTLQPFFEGLFPRDNPRNTRFAINFFTSIGLGGLTDELREHLKNAPKMIMTQAQEVESSDSDSSSSSSDSTSSDSSSESDSSDDSSSESSPDSSSDSSSNSSDAKRKKKVHNKKDKHAGRERSGRRHENQAQDDIGEDTHQSSRRRERDRDHQEHHRIDRDRDNRERVERDRADRSHSNADQPRKHNRDREDRQLDSHKPSEGVNNGSRSERDQEGHRTREKEPESRSRPRSKSRERSRKVADSRDSHRNGVERSDKDSRHSDKYRESRRNDDRGRDASPRRRR